MAARSRRPAEPTEPRTTELKITELKITDPRAMRALAHPARQRLITELFSGEVLTATEAAQLCDLTPSAMSYHLRALEKWGIVVRDDATGDARERPWRAAADSLSVTPQAHRAAGADASRVSVHAWFADLEAGLDRLSASVSADGVEQGMTSRGRLWLTEDEERDLRQRWREVAQEFRGRTRRDHPEGATPFDIYALILPAEPTAP